MNLDPLRRAGRGARALAIQRATRPDPRHVLFNSFGGQFSDSPRAVHEALAQRAGERSHAWIATSPDAFPPGTRPVASQSVSYLRAAGEAGAVVSNVPMPNNLVKRRGMTYVQTWHGTPLKRIGYDNERWQRDPSGLRGATRDIARWDYLISQNPFSTEVLRSAFRYEGTILETGYPRNDALSAPDREAAGQEVRRRLGIAQDARVILYAPTWRDTLVDEHGRMGFSLALDVQRLAERLPPDDVLLLRLHYTIAADLADAYGDAAINVSAHPDIRELYLAADVLITDYSSAMFDFAVTGRPLVFFTYDLAEYRDDVRGFYFDLADVAPGPLCASTDEVIDALLDLDAIAVANAERHAAFRARFCPWDDGGAADRVIDAAALASG